MATYRVTIKLQPISYELEASSVTKAKEYAEEFFNDETIYDILKNADYIVEGNLNA
jgi:hypothetical protein